MPPLGLAYLAGSLREAGHDVTLIDGIGERLDRITPFGTVYLWGLSNSEILERIPSGTNLLGVGCMFSSQWLTVRGLLEDIKGAFPGVPLLLGGEHATGLPEFSFEKSPIDLLALGEGEETMVELAEKIQRRESVADVAGIAYRTGSDCLKTTSSDHGSDSKPLLAGAVVLNPRRKRRREIDDIPLPAWDLIDLAAYHGVNAPHGVPRGRFIPMLATRGCPFQCTFCTSPQMWTTLWLPRAPEKVVDEMQLYKSRYGIEDFQFEDLTAVVRKDWIVAFCQELIDRRMDITFQLPSGTRSEGVDQEAAILMKRAGCHEFAFAPESGDEETLKIIKKRVDLDNMYVAAKEAIGAGINVACFFIVGFPHERWKHILNTYRAIAKCAVIGIKTVSMNVFSPQPSTALFDELQAQGKITLDDAYLWSLFEFPAIARKKRSFNPRFSDRAITAISLGGFILFFSIRFLLRPHLLVVTAWELLGDTSDNRLGKYLRAIRHEIGLSAKARRKKHV